MDTDDVSQKLTKGERRKVLDGIGTVQKYDMGEGGEYHRKLCQGSKMSEGLWTQ